MDALGDIGSFNLNEIARVIAKNRSLYVSILVTFQCAGLIFALLRTAENSQLFYHVKNTDLTLYDATSMSKW